MKKDLKQKMVNMAPKTLFGFAVALSLISCDAEPSPRDLAYMSPSERYQYENYGFVPDDISEAAGTNRIAGALYIFVLSAGVAAGFIAAGKDKKSR